VKGEKSVWVDLIVESVFQVQNVQLRSVMRVAKTYLFKKVGIKFIPYFMLSFKKINT